MCVDEIIGGRNLPIKLWAPQQEIESGALSQLIKVTSLPWVYHHVASMADVHEGKGACVGTVVAMKDAVSPALCGVDIGCGMGAIKTNLTANDLPNDLKKLRMKIEDLIPVGFNRHEKSNLVLKKTKANALFSEFKGLHHKVHSMQDDAIEQCGTLGGGNHFIELCLDTNNNVWMMLHSGSRRIGKELAEIHIEKAKKLAHNQNIVDRDLAVFLAGTTEMADYRRDLYWAQRYAFLNREIMFELYKKAMLTFFPNAKFEEAIMCHHNYVAEEIHFGEQVFVTRKGAINAEAGKMGIIPGSMGAKSFIVEGLGNPDSFNSASHGAGRKMSRGAAKRNFTLDDLEKQTAGVECRKDQGVLDEIPGCYKDIATVMNNQKDLVKIVAELKQVLCVKG